MGDVQQSQQQQQTTSESDEPEKKRRISCDYPGIFIQTAKNIANLGYIGCDKSFLRCVFQSKGELLSI